MTKNNYWSPYIAGGGIGLTLLATFYIAGWGLGASSAFSLLTGVGLNAVNPTYARSLSYFSQYLNIASPLMNWVLFELGGLFLGALAAAVFGGDFRFRFDRGRGMGVTKRLLSAVAGGILIGFASRLARGCTSGVALSGGAQLAVGGWLFVVAMFVGGFITAALFKRLWA